MSRRVALVTGANRGLGFEVCRQLAARDVRVVMSARDPARARRASRVLTDEGHRITTATLDVTDPEAIERVVADIDAEFGRLDILVNNAVVAIDPRNDVLDVPLEILRRTFAVNLEGPLLLCRACVPLMQRHGYGRIVNVSSGRGSFFKLAGDGFAYRVSKTALNALTRALSVQVEGSGILVNAVTPGHVRTRINGLKGPRSVAEGAAGIVWAATLPDDGPSGGFFKDGEPFPW